MMNKILFLGLAAGILATSNVSTAAPWGSVQIDERRAQLERRIDHGMRDGSLTRSEAYRLRTGLDRISYVERRYSSFGLSPQERRDLNDRLDRLSAQVQAERHDWQTRRG